MRRVQSKQIRKIAVETQPPVGRDFKWVYKTLKDEFRANGSKQNPKIEFPKPSTRASNGNSRQRRRALHHAGVNKSVVVDAWIDRRRGHSVSWSKGLKLGRV